ncbi:MAG: AAA family ATPase, partial [Bacteroidota bacterium]
MPQQTKIFRLFVSSTFTDMKEERRILQKEVFPDLEKFCEEKGARFQAVDLRWGVNEESSLNQKTLSICFNEIARCQKISPKPNFLILMGDKYGWQPIPEIIPEEEMNSIHKVISLPEKEVIVRWYFRDENAIPPEFVLQPKTEELKEYKNWEPIESEIRSILRNTVNRLDFTQAQKVKYFASATHQEIIRGALKPPEDGEKPEEHVLSFIRTINGLPQNNSAKGFLDLADEKPDRYCKNQVENLKSELKNKLGPNCIGYTTEWKTGKSQMSESDRIAFKDKVLSFLKDIITIQISGVIDLDEVNQEVRMHKEFKERLTQYFKGRDEILQTIQKYLENWGEKRVMSLIGASGSGKSSVLAQAVKLNEKSNKVIVYRFIGTTSRSSNIMSLLQSLCGQIAKEFNIDPKSLAREGDDKAWYDINGLSEILRKCLAMATAEKPIMLFLDSLDQLSETDNAKALYWLPRELPEHAHIVVSSLPELVGSLGNTYQEVLPVLPEAEARQILDQWFNAIHRKLTKEQHELVIGSFNKTKLPIYLKLAFEKAKHWHSYDKKHLIKEDVAGIINDYFDDLEDEHTKDFVTSVTCYLLCGRYQGLAENEILEILVFDKEYWKIFLDKSHEEHRKELEDVTKIPIVVWSRLFLDLEPFLTERDADGVPIITFFHRQFNEVLRKRYRICIY